MPQEEAIKVHWRWHVPGWALYFVSLGFLALAAFNLISPDGGYVVAMPIWLGVTQWCLIAIVFRKSF